MKESVVVKLTSAIAVEGQIVRAGELVELSHAEAVNLLHRGKCTIADESDISLTEDEQREEVERIQQEQAEAIEQQKRDEAEHAEEAAQKTEADRLERDLDKMRKPELVELAKSEGVEGADDMTVSELREALQQAE